jgi:two-component system, NarL family, invasion response regulator UvrY
MSDYIRVMLVDDHALVRMGFRLLFDTTPDIRVIAEASSAEQAYRDYPSYLPDVILMDLTMTGASGLEATHRILSREPKARILGLSMHEDAVIAGQMLKAGAMGYLTKASAPDVLIGAVREVAAGRGFVEAALAQRLAVRRTPAGSGPMEVLSVREFEVFLHLANGLTVNRIADLLSLSPRTVGSHLYNIKQKLRVEHQTELALIAVRHGLIGGSPGAVDARKDA